MELLKWQVPVERGLPIGKRNFLLLIFGLILITFFTFLFVKPKRFLELFDDPTFIILNLVFIGILVLFSAWNYFSSKSLEFSMDGEGISKIFVRRSGKPSLIGRLTVGYYRYVARMFENKAGDILYMPYNAVAYYKISARNIELIQKIPGKYSFLIVTNNNQKDIISILKKYNISQKK